MLKSQATNCHLHCIYVIASGKSRTEMNTGLLTYTSLCMADLFSFHLVQCVYGFRVGIGCRVKVKFCSDRNAVDTSHIMWGTIRVPIQGVLRGITGLGMLVCCNVFMLGTEFCVNLCSISISHLLHRVASC